MRTSARASRGWPTKADAGKAAVGQVACVSRAATCLITCVHNCPLRAFVHGLSDTECKESLLRHNGSRPVRRRLALSVPGSATTSRSIPLALQHQAGPADHNHARVSEQFARSHHETTSRRDRRTSCGNSTTTEICPRTGTTDLSGGDSTGPTGTSQPRSVGPDGVRSNSKMASH